ncbi:MAG: hypothetical protein RBT16_04690, partial [Desulfococcus multivorans]|nr:hypothetical protein [Desulfococcus multivorans]
MRLLSSSILSFKSCLLRSGVIAGMTFVWLFVPLSIKAGQQSVAILLSREIAPYIEMVEGVEEGLAGTQVQRFFLDDRGTPYSLVGQSPHLDPRSFAAVVAVGPESLRYLAPRSKTTPLIYGMVLNPEAILSGDSSPRCGVDLNLPINEQLKS